MLWPRSDRCCFSRISLARNSHKGTRKFCLVKMRWTRYSWVRRITNIVCPVLLVIYPIPKGEKRKIPPIMAANSKYMNSRWHMVVSISGLNVTPLYLETPKIQWWNWNNMTGINYTFRKGQNEGHIAVTEPKAILKSHWVDVCSIRPGILIRPWFHSLEILLSLLSSYLLDSLLLPILSLAIPRMDIWNTSFLEAEKLPQSVHFL